MESHQKLLCKEKRISRIIFLYEVIRSMKFYLKMAVQSMLDNRLKKTTKQNKALIDEIPATHCRII
jgi:hypothetical protein